MEPSDRRLAILLVEDSASDAELILRNIASAGYTLNHVRVENAETLAQALQSGTWDVVLSDYMLPEFDAGEALRIIQHVDRFIPFLIVSGAIGEETAVALMKAGAHDYIMKGNLSRLVPAIERETEEARIRKEKTEAEERLRASMREKEILLKEIHHRVKNNLQITCSLLNLQQQRIADSSMRAVFATTQQRIRSLSIVHEKLYHTPDLANIDLASLAEALSTELLHTMQRESITLSFAIDNIALGIDRAIPCGLLLNELVTNALRHGFPEGREGKISISCSRESGNGCTLIVRDNGVGLPHGFDIRKIHTMGSMLIDALVLQMDGSYAACNDNGAMITVRFPLEEPAGGQ
jgi:two-component sensor histidine kinase